MKYILIVAATLLAASPLWAQEMLLPLKNNAAYLMPYGNEKGFEQDFSTICADRPMLVVNFDQLPECGLSNGKFTAVLQSGVGPFNFTVRYRNASGAVISLSSNEVSNNSYSFENIRAGAYYLSVFDAATGITFEQNVVLPNVTAPPMSADDWATIKAYCADSGRVFRATTGVIAADFYLYRYDVATPLMPLVAQNSQLSITPLAAAPYYIEARANNGCRTYYMFDIEKEPTIGIPFIDDFSDAYLQPNPAKWTDNYAYVNNDMATNPYTVGVATLDGFNQWGQPYDPIELGEGLIDGTADLLTSRPACVTSSGVELGDSLFLSFFYEAQGWGDFPNTQDSLILELQGSDGVWYKNWSVAGPNQKIDNPTFNYVQRTIVDPLFLYEGLQFRFRNRATISGANDHWHIDYITLDTLSNASAVRNDVAFPNIPASMVHGYQAIPCTHYANHLYDATASQTEVPVTLANMSTQGRNRNVKLTISDACTRTKLYESTPGLFDVFGNITPLGSVTSSIVFLKDPITDALTDNIALFQNTDSIVLENKWESIDTSAVDNVAANDVVYRYQKFYNYYAYDDGTAEKAYGLNGAGAKLAYRFVTLQPDTLRAIQINFVNMNSAIQNYDFRLRVWKSVTENTNQSESLYESEVLENPHFYDQTNGFWTYMLPEPLVVSDTFYIGFEQTNSTILTMGYDHNTRPSANQQLYYNTSGIWYYSLFEGALMMRPLLGAALPDNLNISVGTPTSHAPQQRRLSLYPNPTHQQLRIALEGVAALNTTTQAIIYDYMGKELARHPLQQQQSIDVGALPAGMYIVVVRDTQQNILAQNKFVKY